MKQANPDGTTTLFLGGGLYEVIIAGDGSTSSVKRYYAIAGQRVLRDGESPHYLLADHLGSIVGVLDGSGDLESEQRYLPYGGTRLSPEIAETDFAFTGQRSLEDVGLMDYNARWYSPSIGRFISSDSVIPNAANPQAHNRYAYVLNNPLFYTDYSGHGICEDVTCNTMYIEQTETTIYRSYTYEPESVRLEYVNSYNKAYQELESEIDKGFDPWLGTLDVDEDDPVIAIISDIDDIALEAYDFYDIDLDTIASEYKEYPMTEDMFLDYFSELNITYFNEQTWTEIHPWVWFQTSLIAGGEHEPYRYFLALIDRAGGVSRESPIPHTNFEHNYLGALMRAHKDILEDVKDTLLKRALERFNNDPIWALEVYRHSGWSGPFGTATE